MTPRRSDCDLGECTDRVQRCFLCFLFLSSCLGGRAQFLAKSANVKESLLQVGVFGLQ